MSLFEVCNFEACSFDIAGLRLAGKRWRNSSEGGRRIIALHGWLDNCASFDQLAAQLNADVLCLDLAGHGRSSGRAHLGAYNVWLDVPEVLAVAEQLGWHDFELLGHSRGAAIAFVIAGTFPAKVQRLICLDGIFPLVASEDKAPEQLFHSIQSVKKQLARKQNFYSTFNAAVAAREQGMFPLAHKDALCLAEWGVAECEQGFYWRYDPKASAPSEVRMTMSQVKAFAQNISAPVDLFLASEGIVKSSAEAMNVITQAKDWCVTELAGSHHFHMSECSAKIAQDINRKLGA